MLGRALGAVTLAAFVGCGGQSHRTERAKGDDDAGASGSASGGSSGDASGAAAGSEAGGTTPTTCTLTRADPQCGTGPLGSASCSETFGVMTAHHAGAAWLHFSEPPTGFSDLYAFGCERSGEWSLPRRLAGALVPSFEEFPFLVWRDGESLTLYRGLPDEPREETAPGELETLLLAGPNALGWGGRVDLEDGLVHFRLHEGPSLDIDAERATFELQGLVGDSLFLHAGRPAVVFERLEEGWVAGSLTGETPLGIRPNSTSVGDFLLDREPIAAQLGGVPELWSGSAAVTVSGADPEYSAAQIRAQYNYDAGWAERVTRDPLSLEYVPAPVLWLDRSAYRPWDEYLTCDLPITDPPPYQKEIERAGLHRVVFKLGRDSEGTPWLVAVRETGWGICTYTGTPAEEDPPVAARYERKFTRGGSYLELVLTRLALPTMQRVHRLTESNTWWRYELVMEGAIGTVVFEGGVDVGRAVSLWRVDLDAP